MSIDFKITGLEEVMAKLDPRQLRGAMHDTLVDLGKEAKADFGRITATWEHSVPIDVIVDASSRELLVGTDDKIFGYLEHGVKGHWIAPKQARALAWRSGFRPKTTIGGIQAGAGGSYGPMAFSRGHWWPGIRARRWLPKIKERMSRKTPTIAKKHIERWFRM